MTVNNLTTIKETRTAIACKGRIRGTSRKCEAVVAETDGQYYYFKNPSGSDCKFNLRNNSIVCEECGYETRLRYISK